MPTNNDSSTTRSVERTLDVLECFISEEKELSLTEISERIGLSLSTVHRLVNTLTNRQYLIRNESNKKYFLGPKVMQLGSSALSIIQNDLRSIAYPYLYRLYERFHESVGLYVIEGDHRLCIDRIQSTQVLRNVVSIGQMIPLSLGGVGNVMLAYMPLEMVKSIIPNYSSDMEKKLEKIRQDKYYISYGERIPGIVAIAVPILNSLGNFVCSLNISGPEIRFSKDSMEEKVSFVTDVGRDFSRRLGYKGEY